MAIDPENRIDRISKHVEDLGKLARGYKVDSDSNGKVQLVGQNIFTRIFRAFRGDDARASRSRAEQIETTLSSLENEVYQLPSEIDVNSTPKFTKKYLQTLKTQLKEELKTEEAEALSNRLDRAFKFEDTNAKIDRISIVSGLREEDQESEELINGKMNEVYELISPNKGDEDSLKAEQLAEAFKVASSISDETIRTQAMAVVEGAMMQVNELNIEPFLEKSDIAEVRSSVASYLVENEDFESTAVPLVRYELAHHLAGKERFVEAFKVAYKIPDESGKSKQIQEIVKQLFTSQTPNVELLLEKNDMEMPEIRKEVALYYASIKEFPNALNTAEKISSEELRSSVTLDIAKKMLARRKPDIQLLLKKARGVKPEIYIEIQRAVDSYYLIKKKKNSGFEEVG